MAQMSIKKTLAKMLQWMRMPVVIRDTANAEPMYKAKRSDTGVQVDFGVGSDGYTHGVFSRYLSKWLIYGDNTTVYVNGVQIRKTSGNATKVGNYYTSGSIIYYYNSGCVTVRLNNVTFATFTGTPTIATIPAGFRPAGATYGTFSHGTTDWGSIWVDGSGNLAVSSAVSGQSSRYGTVTYAAWQ